MLTFYLPKKLRPWAKAINASLAGIALIVLHGAFTGEWDLGSLETLIGAGLLGGVVFATPNQA